MVACPILHNPHTLRSLPPDLAPPNPFRIFLSILPPLLLFPSPYANLVSIPNLLPIASPKDTFVPSGYFLHIPHTSSSLPSSHAVPLPSLAVLLNLDSPIGHVLPPHTPNTLLAVLFPHGGMLKGTNRGLAAISKM